MHAEAGNDFVEDQQRTAIESDGTQAFEKPGIRWNATAIAEKRLANDGGDVRAALREDPLYGIEIVPLRDERLLRRQLTGRNGYGDAIRCVELLCGGVIAGEDAVAPPVIMSFKFQDQAAAGRGTREAQGYLYDFGSAVGEADRISARDYGAHAFGDGILQIMLRAKGKAPTDLTAHGFHNFRRGMAQDQRSPGETVVDIGVLIDVDDAGAVAGFKEEGVGSRSAPDTASNTAGQRSPRTLEARQRTGGFGANALFTLGGVKNGRGRSSVPGSTACFY